MKEYVAEYIVPVEKKGNDRLFDFMNAKQLIRCRDCKYYNPQQHYCEGIGNWFGYDDEWSDNGYCYKAEPKEKE